MFGLSGCSKRVNYISLFHKGPGFLKAWHQWHHREILKMYHEMYVIDNKCRKTTVKLILNIPISLLHTINTQTPKVQLTVIHTCIHMCMEKYKKKKNNKYLCKHYIMWKMIVAFQKLNLFDTERNKGN